MVELNLQTVLKNAVEKGSSDLHVSSGRPLMVRIDGELELLFGKRVLHPTEIDGWLQIAYSSPSGLSRVKAGEDCNFTYAFESEGKRYRFRVNATTCTDKNKRTVNLVFRALNDTPPTLASLGVEEELVNSLVHLKEGLVLVAGITGSGKSTLLASVIRARLEMHSEVIITHESPIEYVYDIIPTRSVIYQRSIGEHGDYKTFYDALVGALRQDPDLILVGEARDKASLEACIQGVQTGHGLFSTVHTDGVIKTVDRMIREFPVEERDSRRMDLIEALRVIVYQKLVKKVGGGRVALREYLIFNEAMKTELTSCKLTEMSSRIRKLLHMYGKPLLVDAELKARENLICSKTLTYLKKERGANL